MSQGSTVALLGGPESGKSTYLGAVVRALEGDNVSRLRLGQLPSDATAYDRLSAPLYESTYIQRTKAERHVLDLPLRTVRGDRIEDISLSMGDYDGEEVEGLFKHRNQGFSPEWKARANARGLLIFIRRKALSPLPRLTLHELPTDRERMLALKAAGEQKRRAPTRKKTEADPEAAFGAGLKDEAQTPSVAAPHDPVQVPTVLAVVELLQFLRHVRGLEPGERPKPGEMRIALLAAAWDAEDQTWNTKGPCAFFAERAPLLGDFLWSNYHPEDVFCFGLSSTGGDLRDKCYQEQYREAPHGFVVWADASGRIHRPRNLALPMEWVLFGDEALAGQDSEGVQS